MLSGRRETCLGRKACLAITPCIAVCPTAAFSWGLLFWIGVLSALLFYRHIPFQYLTTIPLPTAALTDTR